MKIIVTVFCLLLGGLSIAQNFSVADNDTLFYGDVGSTDFAAKILIENDSVAPVPMSFELYSEDIETGWEYSLCDPTVCHPVGTTSASFNLPTGSAIKYMNIHYFPNGYYGQSTVTVKLWEDAYPDDFVLLTWVGVVSALGLENEEKYDVFGYFNNASSAIQINYSVPENKSHTLSLYDISGRVIDSRVVNGSTGKVEVGSNLNSGVYFYSIEHEGQKIFSSKVIVP